jgi:hypothetical protein
VCLALFALSPIADIYSDSLCSPLVFLNCQNDADDPVITDELNLLDNLNSIHAIKASEKASQNYHALLQASIKYGPACRIEKNQISANDIKSSQICVPVSSDLSPPVRCSVLRIGEIRNRV